MSNFKIKTAAGREITLTREAADNVEECGPNIDVGIAFLRAGVYSVDELLEACLDGADPEYVQGWHDYVDAVSTYAAGRLP